VAGLVALFLSAPVLLVIVYSFSSKDQVGSFGRPSLRWYRTLIGDSNVLASLRTSIEIALVTMVIATVLGTLLAIGMARGKSKIAYPIQGMLLLTLVTPEVATAMALFLFFFSIHMTLSNTTVILGHVTFSIVFVVVIIRARLVSIPLSIEEAAMDLGANEAKTLGLIVLPQLLPAIVGSALLVFVFSFDDFVTSFFTSGVGTSPLPVYIYSMLKFGLSPEINAIGTLMLVASILLGLLAVLLLRVRQSTTSRALPF
jgi:ABC-type spermidine/putrescine transport system permease subunit II